jgi:hypothetical protein
MDKEFRRTRMTDLIDGGLLKHVNGKLEELETCLGAL